STPGTVSTSPSRPFRARSTRNTASTRRHSADAAPAVEVELLPKLRLDAHPLWIIILENQMRVQELSALTSPRLIVIAAQATLQVVARSLSTPGIGLVMVCDANGRAVGVLSQSDLIRHLAQSGPVKVPITTLMSRDIVACAPDDDLYTVWETMAAQRLHNMP